jgi:hypothetical protein
MDITEVSEEVGSGLAAEIAGTVPCEECGAPLDRLQRYCVSCGTRRLAVADPATAYLAQASARARVRQRAAAGSVGASRGNARGRLNRTTALLALIAVLVAIGIGVLIGQGTGGSNDSAQIERLSQQVAKLQAGGGVVGTPSATGSSSSSSSTTASTGTSSSSGVDNATGKAYLKKALSNSGSSVTVP